MIRFFSLTIVSMILLAGCASKGTPSASATTQPMAECPVCKANADLACVDVKVDHKTPCCQMSGKTTYFCSEECKAEYLAHPAKYPTN